MPDKKRYALVVEDDIIMGMELEELLETLGYKTLAIASSGESAIKAVRLQRPDFVLMDIKLKGAMNGIEAARNLRLFTQVPIIFLTGYKNSGMAEKVNAIQNSSLITKPFDPAKLSMTVKKIWQNNL